MNFTLSDKLEAALKEIREVMRDEVYPLEKDFLDHGSGFREMLPRLQAVRQRVKERGLWAPFLPQEYGGIGFSLSEFAHISEELGRSRLGTTFSIARRQMWAIWNCSASTVLRRKKRLTCCH